MEGKEKDRRGDGGEREGKEVRWRGKRRIGGEMEGKEKERR